MFSFGPAIKLESLAGVEGNDSEEAEPQSHAPASFLASPFFHSLAQHRPLVGDFGSPDRRPLAMLQRLGWDAAAWAAATGDLNSAEPGAGGGGDVGGCLTEALAATAERLQADYLQYCLAKESARLFYSRLAAQLQPPLPHHTRLV
jgi:hypothetical protein